MRGEYKLKKKGQQTEVYFYITAGACIYIYFSNFFPSIQSNWKKRGSRLKCISTSPPVGTYFFSKFFSTIFFLVSTYVLYYLTYILIFIYYPRLYIFFSFFQHAHVYLSCIYTYLYLLLAALFFSNLNYLVCNTPTLSSIHMNTLSLSTLRHIHFLKMLDTDSPFFFFKYVLCIC
jgi:hypothetical protein